MWSPFKCKFWEEIRNIRIGAKISKKLQKRENIQQDWTRQLENEILDTHFAQPRFFVKYSCFNSCEKPSVFGFFIVSVFIVFGEGGRNIRIGPKISKILQKRGNIQQDWTRRPENEILDTHFAQPRFFVKYCFFNSCEKPQF